MSVIFKHKISILVFLLLFAAGPAAARAEWSRQESGTLAWLHSIFFVSENKGWIGGSGGTLLVTDDGGASWKPAAKFTGDAVRDIYFSDENNGWLLCERSVYFPGAGPPSYLLHTTDGGRNWDKVEFAGIRRERVADIFFTADGYGAAIGEAGAFFVMEDDRKTWKKQPAPTRYLMTAGVFTDKSKGVMIGAGGTILFTEDAGYSWEQATLGGGGRAKLGSVFFIDGKNGWAVGAEGKIYQTINGGRFWREQASGTNRALNDIVFLNTAEGWAVGDYGTILQTTTAGNVWQPVGNKSTHKLERLIFNGKRGFAVGFGGTLLRYEKGRAAPSPAASPQLQRRN